MVIGADVGAGPAIVVAAAETGAVVVAAGAQPESVYDLVAAYPQQVEALGLDAADPASVERAMARTVNYHSRIDVLVNGPGDRRIEDAVLPYLSAQGAGAIVRPGVAGDPVLLAAEILADLQAPGPAFRLVHGCGCALPHAGSRPKALQHLGSRAITS
ncbi:hypothetical protein GCM10009534_04660 [Kribbella sandramycini]|nr:SDR family NAD(P)-dependent oxidoreductase [Kribbella sandramycini]